MVLNEWNWVSRFVQDERPLWIALIAPLAVVYYGLIPALKGALSGSLHEKVRHLLI